MSDWETLGAEEKKPFEELAAVAKIRYADEKAAEAKAKAEQPHDDNESEEGGEGGGEADAKDGTDADADAGTDAAAADAAPPASGKKAKKTPIKKKGKKKATKQTTLEGNLVDGQKSMMSFFGKPKTLSDSSTSTSTTATSTSSTSSSSVTSPKTMSALSPTSRSASPVSRRPPKVRVCGCGTHNDTNPSVHNCVGCFASLQNIRAEVATEGDGRDNDSDNVDSSDSDSSDGGGGAGTPESVQVIWPPTGKYVVFSFGFLALCARERRRHTHTHSHSAKLTPGVFTPHTQHLGPSWVLHTSHHGSLPCPVVLHASVQHGQRYIHSPFPTSPPFPLSPPLSRPSSLQVACGGGHPVAPRRFV